MLEKQLIEHCSPTLASLKTANLFTYRYAEEDGLMESLYKNIEGNFDMKIFESGVKYFR